jgi:MFS family permease
MQKLGDQCPRCRLLAQTKSANSLHSAINGILAMDAFLKQFTTGFLDDSGSPAFLPAQTAIIVAILSAGTAVGALLGAPSADYIGRRWSLLVSVGVFCFGVIFQACADAIPMLLVGR